jgi:acetyl-CoA carboxylase alpha subunit
MIMENFVELHGDRLFKDDHAIVGGFAKLDEYKVMLLVIKGRDTNQIFLEILECLTRRISQSVKTDEAC